MIGTLQKRRKSGATFDKGSDARGLAMGPSQRGTPLKEARRAWYARALPAFATKNTNVPLKKKQKELLSFYKKLKYREYCFLQYSQSSSFLLNRGVRVSYIF